MLNRQSKAFTLIELLVVIAIILLLVSILLPSLNRAKVLARRVMCLGNLNQTGSAMMAYTAANKRQYPYRENWSHLYRRPPRTDGTEVLPTVDGWVYVNCGLLVGGDYMSLEALRCPGSRSYYTNLGWDWDGLELCTWGWGAQSFPGTNLYLHPYRSISQVAIDEGWANSRYKALRIGYLPTTVVMTDKMLGRYGGVTGFWHGKEGANTLFVDGSARWVVDSRLYERILEDMEDGDVDGGYPGLDDCWEYLEEAY